MKSLPTPHRRQFLKSLGVTTAAATAGVWTSSARAQSNAAIEKLNVACIGTANRAAEDVKGVESENIVALCDVDQNYLNRSAKSFPSARLYADYREMIVAEADKIDAVVVGTTDHHHAPATMQAIRAGKHVYCEKPLTHTVAEARIVTEAAAEAKVATQLGTQIHAGDNYRRVVEIIRSGAIGDVTDVHVWVNKAWGGGERPEGEKAPPAHLSWDLWLGPAPYRPFWPGRYHPAQWRRWWDFGGGTLADMACHFMDLPFWALKLKYPTSCVAESGEQPHPETCPLGIKVKYEFPARDDMVATNLTWYDGKMIPKNIDGEQVPGNGVMFIGTEGKMFADYSSYKLFPEEKFKGWKPPAQSIPKSIGHHAEWIKACKEGTPTTCDFSYSGPLSETVLLGNVAFRTGKALNWNSRTLEATGVPEAQEYIRKEYREGWEVVALEAIAARKTPVIQR